MTLRTRLSRLPISNQLEVGYLGYLCAIALLLLLLFFLLHIIYHQQLGKDMSKSAMNVPRRRSRYDMYWIR